MNGYIATIIGTLTLIGGVVTIGTIAAAINHWAQNVSDR